MHSKRTLSLPSWEGFCGHKYPIFLENFILMVTIYGMESLRKTHTQAKSNSMREQPILDPVLPYGVPFEGSILGKVSLYKCVDYNGRHPYKFHKL
jgi:hypothetical protein